MEIIWTVTPALILMAIALPSLKLLYMMDEVIDPELTLKAVGFLIGGLKSCRGKKMEDTKLEGKKNNKNIKNNMINEKITSGSLLGNLGLKIYRGYLIRGLR